MNGVKLEVLSWIILTVSLLTVYIEGEIGPFSHFIWISTAGSISLLVGIYIFLKSFRGD